jgi:hypothetical protein
MVLATGSMERDNPADHLTMQARLHPTPAPSDVSGTTQITAGSQS